MTQKQQMTTNEARQRISKFTGHSVSDAYLLMPELKKIVNALPSTDEALAFLHNVVVMADTDKQTINGQVWHKEYKRLKRNAQKLVQQLQDNQTLF